MYFSCTDGSFKLDSRVRMLLSFNLFMAAVCCFYNHATCSANLYHSCLELLRKKTKKMDISRISRLRFVYIIFLRVDFPASEKNGLR